jgi:maleate cis-trans isomerase
MQQQDVAARKRSTYGAVAKIGVIVPPNNLANEVEFHAMAPKGVTSHFTRLPIHLDTSEQGKAHFFAELEGATKLIAEAQPDVVLYSCTVSSILFPADEICARMRRIAGVPAVTTAPSLVAAFNRLGAKKIALVTPYDEPITMHEKEWLEHEGFEVTSVAFHGFGTKDFLKLKLLGPDDAKALVARAAPEKADAIFISCADFACADAIEEIEKKHGKPVVTSVQASLWSALRAAGKREPIHGYGRLLTMTD